jgi:DNA-binding MarR family transcriptional regulator
VTSRLARNLRAPADAAEPYRLDEQIGFVLRRATQRHLALFAAGMGSKPTGNGAGHDGDAIELTPMQWAALARLYETGPRAQNALGRATAMDGATIKGVVDRLESRGLVAGSADPADGRRRTIALTDEGRELVARAAPVAAAITRDTLAPLTAAERTTLLALLKKLA